MNRSAADMYVLQIAHHECVRFSQGLCTVAVAAHG